MAASRTACITVSREWDSKKLLSDYFAARGTATATLQYNASLFPYIFYVPAAIPRRLFSSPGKIPQRLFPSRGGPVVVIPVHLSVLHRLRFRAVLYHRIIPVKNFTAKNYSNDNQPAR